MKGYLQVYTGDGKGKSTAAFGLALRGRGAGLRVKIIQFIKNKEYSETAVLKNIGVTVLQFGEGLLFGRPPEEADFRAADEGLQEAAASFRNEDTDILILDEINVTLGLGLIQEEPFLKLLGEKPSSMEVICTGRRAPGKLLELADLITEMKAVKHYYEAGIPARTGIEK
ncbi:MAG: cob(I)yrinic acid a,c-diamide adenosyltransferase [Candidatus Latescibacterota bacterium]|nr:MAG: cob(I)yrinic acid a,c-diamide adenosyltransferase [Candidatus Latescibacterota bacterium]